MRLFKSRKTYYFYNPNTLNYERVYPSAKDKFFSILKHLTTGIAFGVVTFFVMLYLIDSPMESQLRKENKLLQTQYEVLSLRLNSALEVLNDIQVRDEKLYRAIFQAEPIPESVRQSGFGGSNRYEHLLTLSNSELIVSTTQKLDMLRKQLYIESNSLNEFIEMGKNQEERNRCIPAIQPIANKDLRRTASGYGMRIHPIYRTKRFHSGMDFSANVGTEIYATGDGKVTYASWKQGYGNTVVIENSVLANSDTAAIQIWGVSSDIRFEGFVDVYNWKDRDDPQVLIDEQYVKNSDIKNELKKSDYDAYFVSDGSREYTNLVVLRVDVGADITDNAGMGMQTI